MRTEKEIIAQILRVANTNDKIRAVLLTGSRADPNAVKDIFQDFDIIYVVAGIETFINDKDWINVFGERLMLQLPDEMTTGDKDDHAFHYLMLFRDGNRIDLTLFPAEKLSTAFKNDSLTTVLLDKDQLFENLIPNHKNYLIKRPAQKEFADCCNEFWWVSTYVAKGLWRKEVTYAKQMMEIPVRTMFLKIIEWYIGIKTDFTVCFGKGGRNMKQYISAELYNKILATYSDGDINNTWNSLFLMTDLFDELSGEIAKSMNFSYNNEEANNAIEYLQSIYRELNSCK